MTSTHANVAYSRAHATIMDRNHAARLFFSLAIEQSNEEAIWARMLSSPHIEIKHRVSCSRHLVWCTEHARPRYGSTSVHTTHANRASPARCGRPGQHGSARHGTARHGWLAFTRRLQTEPTRCTGDLLPPVICYPR